MLPVGDVVKRAAPDIARLLFDETFHPGEHLPRRAVREGDQHDPGRPHAVIDEPREPIGEVGKTAGKLVDWLRFRPWPRRYQVAGPRPSRRALP